MMVVVVVECQQLVVEDSNLLFYSFGVMSLILYAGGAIAVAAAAYYIRQRLNNNNEKGSAGSGLPKEPLTHSASVALQRLNQLRKTAFDHNDPHHTTLLRTLWSKLMPKQQPLTTLKSNQWSDVGFQGDDPATDFRGMGMLALELLVHMTKHHQEDLVQRILQRPDDDLYFYFFAVGGINIGSLVYQFLAEEPFVANQLWLEEEEHQKKQQPPYSVLLYYELVVHEWLQFDDFFIRKINEYMDKGGERALCIMQFENIRRQFIQDQRKRWKRMIGNHQVDELIFQLYHQVDELVS